MMKKKMILFLSISVLVLTGFLAAQDTVNLNDYYKFPLSVGVEYQSLTPLSAFEEGGPYTAFEAAINVRIPIPAFPLLQPAVRGGYLVFNSNDTDNPDQWDQNCIFGSLGAVFSNRFNKNFEIGGDLFLGYSYAGFNHLASERVFSNRLFAEGGLRISLVPSYSFSIDIVPNIRYYHALEPFFTDFNGLVMGIGFSGNFRFGEDPDSPQAMIRSLKIQAPQLPPLFAAMQSYYVKHPVGSVEITNIEKAAVRNLEVSFFQPGFMDSPTAAGYVDELAPGETVTVDLLASFNGEVFNTEGTTPLTGEVIAAYTYNGKPAEQRQSVGYDLYDKRSMTWDDDRKVAAFITPADSALQNFTSYIRTTCKDYTLGMYNGVFQSALQVFNALNVIGVLYQADPTAPFASVSGDTMVVDTVSLPRMTLKKITGDCDDLTVLYATLLETLGIETAIITVPGHIFMAFNSKEAGRNYPVLHPDRTMCINIEDQLWIPVEITMIGKTGFLEAWRKGAEEWNAYEEDPGSRAFYSVAECRQEYRPVGLMQTDLGLQYGSPEDLVKRVDTEIAKHMETLAGEYLAKARESGKKQDYNKLGVFYSRFEQVGNAQEAFQKAINIDPVYFSPMINLGNLWFLTGDYPKALEAYRQAMNSLEREGKGTSANAVKLMLNISKVHYEMEDYDKAKALYAEAAALDPAAAAEYSFLGTPVAEGASRASDRSDPGITFVEDEE
ncbi:MAG: tetratricopeptide repeat protein [Spirochaetales bacterium]|nr:tetratricopeptide repeat protein [Spirochaetales bacterium]